jgi:hypothetical protein
MIADGDGSFVRVDEASFVREGNRARPLHGLALVPRRLFHASMSLSRTH